MEKQEITNQIMEQFLSYFTPAATIADATDFLSTTEVCEAINEFAPVQTVKPEQIHELMTTNKFTYAPDPSKIKFQLKWLLIRNV